MNVEEVFKAAPGCQKVLMTALKACRTPRTPSELDSIMDEVLRCNRSVYRPAELRALLERYGALAYEPSEEEQAEMCIRDRLRLVRADARACSESSFGADACCRPGSRGSGSDSGGCSHVGDARACGAAIARRAAGHSGRRFRRWRARRRSERIARQLVRRTYAACSKRP